MLVLIRGMSSDFSWWGQYPSGEYHKVKSTERIPSGSSPANKVDLCQAEQRKLLETDRS